MVSVRVYRYIDDDCRLNLVMLLFSKSRLYFIESGITCTQNVILHEDATIMSFRNSLYNTNTGRPFWGGEICISGFTKLPLMEGSQYSAIFCKLGCKSFPHTII